MSSINGLLMFIKDSYSGAFLVFWSLLVFVYLGIHFYANCNRKLSVKLEKVAFWVFGVLLVFFAASRPIGIARDDPPYLEIFKSICPALTCNDFIQGSRDVIWYSIVGFFKSFVLDPRIMLWIAACGLVVKLAVIFSITKRPLLVLVLYAGIYYQIQDLTALRSSMSTAVFMLSIWLLVRHHTYWSAIMFSVCGLFHKQGFVAPLILVGFPLQRRPFVFFMTCFTPIGLLVFSIYPDISKLLIAAGQLVGQSLVAHGLDAHIESKTLGVYTGWRSFPMVVVPQLLFVFWLLLGKTNECNRLLKLLCGCMAMACMFLWAFASLPEAQNRFFDFFMLPTILLVGLRSLSIIEVGGVIAVSGVYVLKYNVLHNLLI